MKHPSDGSLVTIKNSLVDGLEPNRKLWGCLDIERGWVDAGPSPAGHPGPYLLVPMNKMKAGKTSYPGDAIHRVYRKGWKG